MSHRALRRRILRAQSLTDRYRFAQSIELLEPLLRGLQTLAPVPSGPTAPAEPADVRLWYLPRVQGLLGFNWFHRGDLARARALTLDARETSRALGDRTGVRVYGVSLARVERGEGCRPCRTMVRGRVGGAVGFERSFAPAPAGTPATPCAQGRIFGVFQGSPTLHHPVS